MITAQEADVQDTTNARDAVPTASGEPSPRHRSLWARLWAALRGLLRGRDQATAASAEARYRHIFDGVPIALYLSAPDGRILDVNAAMVDLLGYPDKQALLRQNAFDTFVSREDRRSQMEVVERQQVVRDYELRLRREDGQVIWVLDQVRAVRDAEGRVLYYQGALKDITERKRAEAELRETYEKLRALIQASPLAIFAIDPDGRVLSWNEAAERMFGWREGEVLGRTLPIVQNEARSQFRALREKVLGGERLEELELERRRRDGTPIQLSLSAGPIYDASGSVIGIMSIAADITERKQIVEHRRRLAEILEATPDLVGIFTVDGEGIFLNPAGRRMLGLGEDEVAGTTIWHHHPEPSRELLREVAIPEATRYGIWAGEVVFLARGDREIPASTVMIAHRGAGGVVHLSMIARDLTERKALERRLREAETMEAIGRLAGGIAHDFNNLLTSIIGHSDLLLGRLSDGQASEDLGEIKKAGQRAATLTAQLLAFSRRQLVRPQTIDLNSAIADLGARLGGLTGERIELVTVLDATLGSVNIDPSQLDEIIVSLVENACDAMPDGGKLTLETGLVDLPREIAHEFGITDPGRYSVLAVSDTGHGMDQETLGRIFEPFFSTKSEVRGTGLGLATVYGIVKQAGGGIRVDSQPGRGTTARVYLPVAERDIRSPTVALPGRPAQRAAHGTVLIAEDEPAVLSLAARVLRTAGYTVLEARDGADALDVQARHDDIIDLLLTDVVMPRMDGPELAERLLEARPDVHVIYMSGYTDHRAVRELRSDARRVFLQKPFTPAELVDELARVIDRGR